MFFKKCLAETSIFLVFFWVRVFWPSCPKRELLDTHQKTKENLIDNRKAHFFGMFVFFVFLFFRFLCFLGVRATSLGPKPSLFVFFCLFCFFFVFGGFKGQVRWRKGGHLTWP